jgi:hypothetical protein
MQPFTSTTSLDRGGSVDLLVVSNHHGVAVGSVDHRVARFLLHDGLLDALAKRAYRSSPSLICRRSRREMNINGLRYKPTWNSSPTAVQRPHGVIPLSQFATIRHNSPQFGTIRSIKPRLRLFCDCSRPSGSQKTKTTKQESPGGRASRESKQGGAKQVSDSRALSPCRGSDHQDSQGFVTRKPRWRGKCGSS